ncbi:unnamed protein product, partial [marine sediment metagenome]
MSSTDIENQNFWIQISFHLRKPPQISANQLTVQAPCRRIEKNCRAKPGDTDKIVQGKGKGKKNAI